MSKNTSINIHKTVIFPAVLYWCEILSFLSSEECKVRVLEFRVLRRVFRPKMDEVTGQWERLNNEQLRDLH